MEGILKGYLPINKSLLLCPIDIEPIKKQESASSEWYPKQVNNPGAHLLETDNWSLIIIANLVCPFI